MHRGDSLFAEIPSILGKQLEKSVAMTAENKLWLSVNDRTPVLWEGKPTTWGNLSGNEKDCCDFNSEGVLTGGFPF